MLRQKRYDIILLQETHCNSNVESTKWGNQWGGKSWWANGSSASKGVAVLLKHKFQFAIENIYTHDDGRFISLDFIYDENKRYRITNIYAPNNGRDRKSYFTFIKDYMSKFDYITVC